MNHLQTYEYALEQAQRFVWLLHADNKAMVQLVKLTDGKASYYRSYRGNTLPANVEQWLDQDDIYISLNVFRGVTRQTNDLVGFNALYTDLDFYKLGISKRQARAEIQRMIDCNEIPSPSLLIDSGRGYQLIWLVNFMKATEGYTRLWRRMQGAIYDRFKHLNADNAARSISQIYRLVGSWSSRTGSMITFEHLADRYDIGTLKEALLDDIDDSKPLRPSVKPKNVRRKVVFKESGFSPYTLAKARKSDLEQYVRLRDGCVNRRRFMFYYAVIALEALRGDTATLRTSLNRINDRLHKPLPSYVLDGAIASAVNSWDVKQSNRHLGYKFTNDYLIENLEITDDEQQYMLQLIGQAEKNRRKRLANEKKRREAGMRTALEYKQDRQQAVNANAERLRELLADEPNLTNKELAVALQVSVPTIQRLKRQIKC